MSLSSGRPSKKKKDDLELSDLTKQPKNNVRVNFNLDEDKYIKLKKYAADSRKSVTKILTELIDENIFER